jgi:hypothetical protein
VFSFDGSLRAFKLASKVVVPFSAAQSLLHDRGVEAVLKPPEPTVAEYEAQRDGSTKRRNPVVVLLGHLYHGKTTLLDALADSKEGKKESEGITQTLRTKMAHLGWRSSDDGGGESTHRTGITMLDTPGA